jgi:thymidylate synthase
MWNSRRILKELADNERRREILVSFWKYAEPQSRLLAGAYLAKALHFRDETLKKMPAEKKADLLASRIGVAEFDQFLEMALMQYHTRRKSDLLAAFLDKWGIAHVNGTIESDDYPTPGADQIRDAVRELEAKFEKRDIVLYLATAGLLMGDEWRASTWPIVDEMTAISAA